MLTDKEFISIMESVQGCSVDWEHLLLLVIRNHYRKADKFRQENRTSLYDAEMDKMNRLLDYLESFHKLNKMMED